MAGRLKGKVALVTAAAQGFGRAIAEAFINQSATLIATAVDAKKLKGLAAAQTAQFDVRPSAPGTARNQAGSGGAGAVTGLRAA